MSCNPPPKVNNFLTCKPTVVKSNNVYPGKVIKRNVKEVDIIVNGKVANKNLIHKPYIQKNSIESFPVINKKILKK